MSTIMLAIIQSWLIWRVRLAERNLARTTRSWDEAYERMLHAIDEPWEVAATDAKNRARQEAFEAIVRRNKAIQRARKMGVRVDPL